MKIEEASIVDTVRIRRKNGETFEIFLKWRTTKVNKCYTNYD